MQKYLAALLTHIYYSEGLTADEDNEGQTTANFRR